MVKKVLFLSSANSARSQIAEALLRDLAGDVFEAHSAGSAPRDLDPLAIAVMAERGINIADQRPKRLQEFIGVTEFTHVITVCERDEKACSVFPGKGTREYWPTPDPAAAKGSSDERVATYREVRDQLETRIRDWLRERKYRPLPELDPAGAVSDSRRSA